MGDEPKVFKNYFEIPEALEFAYSKSKEVIFVSALLDGVENSVMLLLKGPIILKNLTNSLIYLALDALLGIEVMCELVEDDDGEGEVEVELILPVKVEREIVRELIEKLRKRKDARIKKLEKKKDKKAKEKTEKLKGTHILSMLSKGDINAFLKKARIGVQKIE